MGGASPPWAPYPAAPAALARARPPMASRHRGTSGPRRSRHWRHDGGGGEEPGGGPAHSPPLGRRRRLPRHPRVGGRGRRRRRGNCPAQRAHGGGGADGPRKAARRASAATFTPRSHNAMRGVLKTMQPRRSHQAIRCAASYREPRCGGWVLTSATQAQQRFENTTQPIVSLQPARPPKMLSIWLASDPDAGPARRLGLGRGALAVFAAALIERHLSFLPPSRWAASLGMCHAA